MLCCNKKLCFVATDREYLAGLLAELVERPDCYYVKYSVHPRDEMYLGRCFLMDENEVGKLWDRFKPHPTRLLHHSRRRLHRAIPPRGLTNIAPPQAANQDRSQGSALNTRSDCGRSSSSTDKLRPPAIRPRSTESIAGTSAKSPCRIRLGTCQRTARVITFRMTARSSRKPGVMMSVPAEDLVSLIKDHFYDAFLHEPTLCPGRTRRHTRARWIRRTTGCPPAGALRLQPPGQQFRHLGSRARCRAAGTVWHGRSRKRHCIRIRAT